MTRDIISLSFREGSKRRGRRQALTEEGEEEGKRGREGGGGGRRRLEGGGEEPTTASSHARHIPETQDSHQGGRWKTKSNLRKFNDK